MADVQFFAPKKEGSVFDPARDAEIRRRRKMAEAMMKAGEQPIGTEMVSGVAVKQSPLGALAKALQQGVAGYQEGKADELDTEAQKKRNEMMAQAIRSSQQDPQAGIDMLAGGDPAMQEMAWKMGQGNIEHERAKEIAQLRAKAISGGGGGGGLDAAGGEECGEDEGCDALHGASAVDNPKDSARVRTGG